MTYAVAELLAKRFESVTLVTVRERIAHDVSLINRQGLYQRLHDLGVELRLNCELKSLDSLEDGVLQLQNVYNGAIEEIDDFSVIIHASSRVPNDQLLKPLRDQGIHVIPIGDCHAPRSLLATTREAYQVASAIV